MSETYWPEYPYQRTFDDQHWLAQTFRPRYSHTTHTIRFLVGYVIPPLTVRVSIQYLKPDGTPTGSDLAFVDVTLPPWWFPFVFHTFQVAFPPTYLVASIAYAFVMKCPDLALIGGNTTGYTPAPSSYPRGHLITTDDWGATWDTSDHGALAFAEFGDPPVHSSRFTPPIHNATVLHRQETVYSTYMCIRIATSEPCHLWCYKTDQEPGRVVGWKWHRGLKLQTVVNLSYVKKGIYRQKEKGDSIYHTFLIKGLTDGMPYWFMFIGEADYKGLLSKSFIYKKVHVKGPPFTKTLRPNAPGDECLIAQGEPFACPDHWDNVNEHSADEDESHVTQPAWFTWWGRDLYHTPDIDPADTLPWEKVVISARLRFITGYAYASYANTIIKTHGQTYHSDSWHPLTWDYKNYHWHLYKNPFTDAPWTTAEINELQIGIALRAYLGIGWGTGTRCTQLWARAYHACLPDE